MNKKTLEKQYESIYQALFNNNITLKEILEELKFMREELKRMNTSSISDIPNSEEDLVNDPITISVPEMTYAEYLERYIQPIFSISYNASNGNGISANGTLTGNSSTAYAGFPSSTTNLVNYFYDIEYMRLIDPNKDETTDQGDQDNNGDSPPPGPV